MGQYMGVWVGWQGGQVGSISYPLSGLLFFVNFHFFGGFWWLWFIRILLSKYAWCLSVSDSLSAQPWHLRTLHPLPIPRNRETCLTGLETGCKPVFLPSTNSLVIFLFSSFFFFFLFSSLNFSFLLYLFLMSQSLSLSSLFLPFNLLGLSCFLFVYYYFPVFIFCVYFLSFFLCLSFSVFLCLYSYTSWSSRPNLEDQIKRNTVDELQHSERKGGKKFKFFYFPITLD